MKLKRRRLNLFGVLSALPISLPVSAAVDAAQASKTLGVVARELFPHETVSQLRYEAVAQAYVTANTEPAQRLAEAVGGAVFENLASSERISALQGEQRSPDFQSFRMHVLIAIYTDLGVTRAFGYEGPSLEKGGYLQRGFDDIAWLPDSSTDAD